jgi:hypothetical protein
VTEKTDKPKRARGAVTAVRRWRKLKEGAEQFHKSLDILTIELGELRDLAFEKRKPPFDGNGGVFNSVKIKEDLIRLRGVLTTSGDIAAFFEVVNAFVLLGRMRGDHPIVSSAKNNLRPRKARDVKAATVQRRREMLTPLILAEIKINPKAVAKRAFEPANKLLEANGEDPIGRSTFAELISKTKTAG